MKTSRVGRWLMIAGLVLLLAAVWLIIRPHPKDVRPGPDAHSGTAAPLDTQPQLTSPSASGDSLFPPGSPLAQYASKIGTTPPGGFGARYTVRIEAGTDGDLGGVGWVAPYGVNEQKGVVLHPGNTWSHSVTANGRRPFVGVYTYTQRSGSYVWCRLVVGGRTIDYQRDYGPSAQVFCHQRKR